MTESHALAELDKAGARRRVQRVCADTQQLGGAPHGQRVADGLCGGDEQQLPGGRRQLLQAPPEARLDVPRERRTGRQSEATGQLGVRQTVR